MRKTTALFLALAAGLSFSAPALADDIRCTEHPRDRWMPIDQVTQRAQALGYTVRQVEADDGCWEVKGTDRNGARIEIKLDPISGEPVTRSQR